MFRIIKTISVLVFLLSAVSSHAETVERIAAVVGDRVILTSELANQVQMYRFQNDNVTDVDLREVARGMLQQMINDELILSAARDDTTITVTAEEIRSELNSHIASMASRFESEEAFLQQLRLEGMTKRSLEKRYRPQIRDQLLKQKIINRKLFGISVSRQEVDEFYSRHADSLPEIPTKIRMAHILAKFIISTETDDSVKHISELARGRLVAGSGFAETANEMAEKYPGIIGGRIGLIGRRDVVEEFGRAAFNLQPGSISGPVRTEYGWHIIESHGRSGDSVDVSQILVSIAPSQADTATARAKIDSLHEKLSSGADFRETAKVYSDDDASRGTGGELEAMALDQIRPEFVEPLNGLEAGQISSPIVSQLGYHIIKLLEREDGRRFDPAEDFDILRNLARQEKTSRMVDEWVAKLKENAYVDIRETDLR